jgi:predicted lipid-binding transport protein (Tim44 family)
MTEIIEGLGSMSAMLIMISIIAIGAIMALRNKLANKRRRRSQTQVEQGKRPEEQGRPESQPETDVNRELDDLKRNVDK